MEAGFGVDVEGERCRSLDAVRPDDGWARDHGVGGHRGSSQSLTRLATASSARGCADPSAEGTAVAEEAAAADRQRRGIGHEPVGPVRRKLPRATQVRLPAMTGPSRPWPIAIGPCNIGRTPYMNSQVAPMPTEERRVAGPVHGREPTGARQGRTGGPLPRGHARPPEVVHQHDAAPGGDPGHEAHQARCQGTARSPPGR